MEQRRRKAIPLKEISNGDLIPVMGLLRKSGIIDC